MRGGGFYGFGYVVAFVVLEVRAFIGNFEGDGDIATMIVQEVLQFFFRFAAQSFINGFIAFGWPVFVLDYLGGWGLLGVGRRMARVRISGEAVDQLETAGAGAGKESVAGRHAVTSIFILIPEVR